MDSGFSPPLDLVQAIGAARKAGAATVALGNAPNSPVSRAAHHVLWAEAPEAAVKFESLSGRIAQLTLVDLLAAGIGLARRDLVTENLGKTRLAIAGSRY